MKEPLKFSIVKIGIIVSLTLLVIGLYCGLTTLLSQESESKKVYDTIMRDKIESQAHILSDTAGGRSVTCNGSDTPNLTRLVGCASILTVTWDSCEYLLGYNAAQGISHQTVFFTHKGNCRYCACRRGK